MITRSDISSISFFASSTDISIYPISVFEPIIDVSVVDGFSTG